MDPYVGSFALFFALLNPFLLSIYLIDLITALPPRRFALVLARGSAIAAVVFIVFAWAGDAIFRDVLQVRFQAFQIFGGVVFALIGVRFVFSGADTLRAMRGDVEHLEGSVAMPFLIGPGTVSASVVIGQRLPMTGSALVIIGTLMASLLLVHLLKLAHDHLKERNARLVARYVDVVGRAMALLTGTIAVDMILSGIAGWQRSAA